MYVCAFYVWGGGSTNIPLPPNQKRGAHAPLPSPPPPPPRFLRQCNVVRTSCGICKGRVHDLIVMRIRYECVHNFIVIAYVCVQGDGVV